VTAKTLKISEVMYSIIVVIIVCMDKTTKTYTYVESA